MTVPSTRVAVVSSAVSGGKRISCSEGYCEIHEMLAPAAHAGNGQCMHSTRTRTCMQSENAAARSTRDAHPYARTSRHDAHPNLEDYLRGGAARIVHCFLLGRGRRHEGGLEATDDAYPTWSTLVQRWSRHTDARGGHARRCRHVRGLGRRLWTIGIGNAHHRDCASKRRWAVPRPEPDRPPPRARSCRA